MLKRVFQDLFSEVFVAKHDGMLVETLWKFSKTKLQEDEAVGIIYCLEILFLYFASRCKGRFRGHVYNVVIVGIWEVLHLCWC